MAEGDFPKEDGSILYASEVNYLHSSILEIDSSSDLDADNSTSDKEYTIDFSDVQPEYLRIEVNGRYLCSNSSGNIGPDDVSLKIEIKEQGGSYSTIFNETIVNTNAGDGRDNNNVVPPTFTHKLTSGEKSNGVVVKITITADAGNGSARYINNQVIIQGA